MQVLGKALKEWSVAIRAIEEGKQFVLLRKGGILEQGFDVASNLFLLFPTFEHQHKDYVRDEFLHLFNEMDERIEIRSAASVYKVYETFSKEKLLRLSRYHIYNDSLIDYRLNTYRDRPVKVLMIRAYMLDNPIVLEDKPEYAGCRSWVDLSVDAKIKGAIISNNGFSAIADEIEGIMNEI